MNFAELDQMPCTTIEEDITVQDMIVKLVIIGDVAVGKSCLMLRATKNQFKEAHDLTIGVEFGSYVIKLDNKQIKMQIWDTAGQESFKSLTRIFYKGAHCVYIVYDIRREETFNKLKEWVNEVHLYSDPDITMVLVGNMCDSEPERKVSVEDAKKFSIQEKFDAYIETSAKTGMNVKELFERTIKYHYKYKSEKQNNRKEEGKQLDSRPEEKKKKCCK